MSKKFAFVVAAGVLALGLTAANARADSINLSPSVGACGSPVCLVEVGTSHSGENEFNSYIETKYLVNRLYKINDNGSEDGTAAGWYSGYLTPSGDPSGGSITWNGPGIISGSPIYVAVKDGNHSPYWYLFNVSGWDGTDTFNLNGFWPQGGAISHVSIYGTQTTRRVPDGGSTLFLLGGALAGIETLRRRSLS